MTKITLFALPTCAVAAALALTPLAAEEPMVVTGEQQLTNQQRVNFADLDLREGAAQATLRRRVRSAATGICSRLGSIAGETNVTIIWSCADQAYSDARPQISAAIGRARSGQLMATNLVISLAARTR